MKDYRLDPIKIPASKSFVKRLNRRVFIFFVGSFIILLIMMVAFFGSFFSPKLIVAVPLLGTAYWVCIIVFLVQVYRISSKNGRMEMKRGLPFYGFILVLIVFINADVLYEVVQRSSDILFQRTYAALSLALMIIPGCLWLIVKKIKVASSLEEDHEKNI